MSFLERLGVFWNLLDVDLPRGVATIQPFLDYPQIVTDPRIPQSVGRAGPGAVLRDGRRRLREERMMDLARPLAESGHDMRWMRTCRPGSWESSTRGTVKVMGVVGVCDACGAAGYRMASWPGRPSGRRAAVAFAAARIVHMVSEAYGRTCDEVGVRDVMAT